MAHKCGQTATPIGKASESYLRVYRLQQKIKLTFTKNILKVSLLKIHYFSISWIIHIP